MAIYHLNAKIVSRGKGQSAIAAAAYRSGDPLVDERTGELKSYDKRSLRIIHKEIMAPAHAPEWARDRSALWNAAERAEKRKDAQLAREIEVSLPHELTEQQRLYLVKDFAREAFMRRGYAVDISIHTPDRGADGRNHHAHLMITMRVLGPDGFAPTKDRSLNSTEQLDAWRAQWANLANRHLERHGHAARIDHRSLEAQGIDREATTHVGYAGAEIAARGAQSDRVDELNGILERNGLRAELQAADAELAQLRALVANENRQAPEPERRTRTMLDGPTDDELKQQPEREGQYLAHMQKEHERVAVFLAERQRVQEMDDRAKGFLQAKAHEAEEGKKRQAEQEAAESRDGRNSDISSAAARYSIALGQMYDVRDPYASLARAAGAEAAAFHRNQEALRTAAARESDPDKRNAVELRRRIEGCEYMAITSDRLAAIGLAVTGRLNSGQAVKDRQQAADWRAKASALREERGALLETMQARSADSTAVREAGAGLETRRAAGAPYRTQMPATAPTSTVPYVPVHPTLPRTTNETQPAPAAETIAKPVQIPEPQRESRSERVSTPPAPAKVPVPQPVQTAAVQPDRASAPRRNSQEARSSSPAPANDGAPPPRAPERVTRPEPVPEPLRDQQPRPAAPMPAAEPPRAVPPTPMPPPARLDPQPFAAVALKPYSVTIAKAGEPRRAAPISPAAPFDKAPQPAASALARPVDDRASVAAPKPAAAPARRVVDASAESHAAARAAGVTIRRVTEPTTEPTNSKGVTRTVEVTDRKAVSSGVQRSAVRKVTDIDRGQDHGRERGDESRR